RSISYTDNDQDEFTSRKPNAKTKKTLIGYWLNTLGTLDTFWEMWEIFSYKGANMRAKCIAFDKSVQKVDEQEELIILRTSSATKITHQLNYNPHVLPSLFPSIENVGKAEVIL
ncbi:unnamed protein product, partial [Wuchereria bancrofti]